MKILSIAAALTIGLCAGGAAQAAAKTAIESPTWRSAPNVDDVKAAFPDISNGKVKSGFVAIGCEFQADGHLQNCHVEDEDPRGHGLGKDLLSVADKFQAYPTPGVDFANGKTSILIAFYNPPPSGTPIELTSPDVISPDGQPQPKPTFPDAAAKAGYALGLGVIDCTANPSGALTDCAVELETPAGLGVGASALAAAQATRLNPWQGGVNVWQKIGPVVGARVRLPIYVNASNALEAGLRKTIITNPSEAARYFPDRAVRMGVSGSATIECVLASTGTLSHCAPRSVSEPGFGFDHFAVRMAQNGLVQAAPRVVDGHPVDGDVVLVQVGFSVKAP